MSTIRSKAIPRSSMLASTAILFGAIFTVLLVPAYGQQEVDPAWYDPTPDTAMTQPAQAAAAVHSSQPAATVHARPATIQSASRTPAAAKARAKTSSSTKAVVTLPGKVSEPLPPETNSSSRLAIQF